jgi:hypothetical protein
VRDPPARQPAGSARRLFEYVLDLRPLAVSSDHHLDL